MDTAEIGARIVLTLLDDRAADGAALFDHFTHTRAIRRSIIEQGQDDARPDFGRVHDGGAAE